MIKIKIAICDDLQADRQVIIDLVNNYCIKNNFNATIVSFATGWELLEFCESKPLDIIFLDIYLTNENGIDIARELIKFNTTIKLIFTTLSYEHMLESFEVFAFNYLLKPVNEENFNRVFSKAILNIDEENQNRIIIKTGDSYNIILHSEILYIESSAKKINFYTIDNSALTCYAKLDHIENDLKNSRFMRCHKSFIVNMDYIQKVDTNLFHLKKGQIVPIKQKDYTGIRKKYLEYISNKLTIDE